MTVSNDSAGVQQRGRKTLLMQQIKKKAVRGKQEDILQIECEERMPSQQFKGSNHEPIGVFNMDEPYTQKRNTHN